MTCTRRAFQNDQNDHGGPEYTFRAFNWHPVFSDCCHSITMQHVVVRGLFVDLVAAAVKPLTR